MSAKLGPFALILVVYAHIVLLGTKKCVWPLHTSVFIAFVCIILCLLSSEWAMRDLLQILLYLHGLSTSTTKRWFFKETLTEWFFVEPKMVIICHRCEEPLFLRVYVLTCHSLRDGGWMWVMCYPTVLSVVQLHFWVSNMTKTKQVLLKLTHLLFFWKMKAIPYITVYSPDAQQIHKYIRVSSFRSRLCF